MAAALVAVLAAADGRGAHIDASMYELCVQQMHAAIVAAQGDAPLSRMGNADPAVMQQDVYPARGEDCWVAISLFDDEDARRLAALTGGRPVAEWTRAQEAAQLVALLQQAGIAAGVAQDIEDLIEHDAALAARGALVELPHPKLGPFGHVRTPISFSADRCTPFRAPAIGEHNQAIALGEAGLTPERLAQLDAAGVLR
jgi:crotonobetainyl-CoA:carnitine CoA-transferase CaiB-like acyl-CoA transferase